MIPEVEYDKSEEELIDDLAWACDVVKARAGKRITRRHSYLRHEEFAIRWITALYCVTKYLGVEMDWLIVPDGNYKRPHFFLERQSCVVRNSTYEIPLLKFDSLRLLRVRLVILCTQPKGKRVVAIHGCVCFQRFGKEARFTTLPGQEEPCYNMLASQMTPIDNWEEEVNWKPRLDL
jgi:hypothetical protein